MRVLGTITAPQSLDNANYLAPFLKSSFDERHISQVRQQWIGCDENMRTGNENR